MDSPHVTTTIDTRRGPVAIRSAFTSDLPAYRQIRLEALRDHPSSFTSDYAACLAWPESRWAERLGLPGSEDQKVTFFAEASGELAAMGGVIRGDSPKTAHTGTVVGIYVRPAWRGLNLGVAIVQACEAWATSRGISILKLAVMSANAFALRIYVHAGYRVYGVDQRSVCINGINYDEILMSKDLP